MLRIKNIDLTYPDVWRVFISGSSSSGKTYFARQLLEAKLFKQSTIFYFHPDIEETFPTDWNDHFPNVIFECGLPNLADLLAMPPYSVVVLDDLFEEAARSKEMSYLFRVLSSKKKLHVIIMTQRYYEGGSPGLTLRNSSTHHILMNNSDSLTNTRVGCSMGLKREVLKANQMNKTKLYPYIAIDRTNHARVNETQVYTDILSPVKEIVIGCQAMNIHYKCDFDKKYECRDGFAVKRKYELDDSDDESYYPSDSSEDSESEYESENEESDHEVIYNNSQSTQSNDSTGYESDTSGISDKSTSSTISKDSAASTQSSTGYESDTSEMSDESTTSSTTSSSLSSSDSEAGSDESDSESTASSQSSTGYESDTSRISDENTTSSTASSDSNESDSESVADSDSQSSSESEDETVDQSGNGFLQYLKRKNEYLRNYRAQKIARF